MYFLFFVSLNYKHIEVSYNVGNTQTPETSMCDVKPNLCIVMAGFDGTLILHLMHEGWDDHFKD